MTQDEFEALIAKTFRDMARDDCEATSVDQQQAFLGWAGQMPTGYSALAAELLKQRPEFRSTDWPFHRIADALVQKLRKAGLIEKQKRDWVLTAEGETLAEALRSGIADPAPTL